jgi:quercetin dioxygenase-like cupin family protein
MIVSNIKNYSNGWFIGNFEPSLLKTVAFEVAHHFYAKGFKGIPHTHRIALEYNYIVSGSLIASEKTLGTGDIFVYEPNDVSDVVFLEDTNLIIIKTPSIPNDKEII